MGSRGLRELNLALPHDSTLMARYRRAGLVLLGRTNTPELGLSFSTEPLAWGPTRNPWNTELSPGGWSGGSAVAVRSGVVPLAYGNDGGGSLRVPASMCGLFVLKPTRGRITAGPDVGEFLHGFAAEHVLTRTVRDSAAMLDATAGPEAGDPYIIPPQERPYLEELGRAPRRLRIALSRTAASGAPVSPECVAAVEDAAKLCASLGHEVVEAAPRYDAAALDDACITLFTGGFATWVDTVAAMTGTKFGPDSFEATTWSTVHQGRGVKAADVYAALGALNQVARAVGRFFEGYDAMLTPTLAVPPWRLGVFDANAALSYSEFYRNQVALCPFTVLINATGQPAMSVPLYWNAEGLPIGVQLAARWGDEATLFRLAAQLEQSRPWAHRWPPVCVA